MDLNAGLRPCKYGDDWHEAGSELCVEDKCMICNDGDWKDKITGLSAFYPTAGATPD